MKDATRLIATILAFAAFAISCVAGVLAHNSSNVVLYRSLTAMVLCYFVGLGIGLVAQVVVRQHAEQYARENPIPEIHPSGKEASEPAPGASNVSTQIAQSAQPGQSAKKAA